MPWQERPPANFVRATGWLVAVEFEFTVNRLATAILPVGGKVRFAAGSPTSLRSCTWMVMGGTSDRDVYVTMRSLSVLKFSLHASQRWRLAYTEVAARQRQFEWSDAPFRNSGEGPRVVARLAVPQPADGWQHALQIVITEQGLQTPFREKPVKGSTISWWSPPGGEMIRVFTILISEPGVDQVPTFENADAVGAIRLPRSALCVVATSNSHHPQLVNLVRTQRTNFESAGWRQDGDKSPLLVRLGAGGGPNVLDRGLRPLSSY